VNNLMTMAFAWRLPVGPGGENAVDVRRNHIGSNIRPLRQKSVTESADDRNS